MRRQSTAIRNSLLLCIAFLAVFLYSCTSHDKTIDQVILKKAGAHLEQVYPHCDFVIDKAYYVFKDNCYCVEVSSPSSQDSYFCLEYHWKTYELLRDTYQDQVLSGENTKNRLAQEYGALVESVMQNTDGLLQVTATLCTYSENETVDKYFSPYGLKSETLTLDHSYNMKDIGREYGYIEISFRDEELSVERCFERLLQIHTQLTQNGAEYFVLALELEPSSTAEGAEPFYIYGITREDLFCEDPLARLQQMWTEQENHRQAVKAEWDKNS